MGGNLKILNEVYRLGLGLEVKQAGGCYLTFEDGLKVLDMCLGAGTHILGHANPLVVETVTTAIRDGTLYTLPTKYLYDLVESLNEALPWASRFIFCNTGTEAIMRAIRIARAVTGRSDIVIFSGGWHGGCDYTLADRATLGFEYPTSGGIPPAVSRLTHVLPRRLGAADAIKRLRPALVLLEPVQAAMPVESAEFLATISMAARQAGALVCLDEIISGFRLAAGGYLGWSKTASYPDLAVYGKVLGGGLPIGMVAGTDVLDEAVSHHAFFGGTFSGNPLAARVAKQIINYLLRHPQIYDSLNQAGIDLREQLNSLWKARSLPARAYGVGSMSRLVFTDKPVEDSIERDTLEDKAVAVKFFHNLLRAQVYASSRGGFYLSTAHQASDLLTFAEAATNALEAAVERP